MTKKELSIVDVLTMATNLEGRYFKYLAPANAPEPDGLCLEGAGDSIFIHPILYHGLGQYEQLDFYGAIRVRIVKPLVFRGSHLILFEHCKEAEDQFISSVIGQFGIPKVMRGDETWGIDSIVHGFYEEQHGAVIEARVTHKQGINMLDGEEYYEDMTDSEGSQYVLDIQEAFISNLDEETGVKTTWSNIERTKMIVDDLGNLKAKIDDVLDTIYTPDLPWHVREMDVPPIIVPNGLMVVGDYGDWGIAPDGDEWIKLHELDDINPSFEFAHFNRALKRGGFQPMSYLEMVAWTEDLNKQ